MYLYIQLTKAAVLTRVLLQLTVLCTVVLAPNIYPHLRHKGTGSCFYGTLFILVHFHTMTYTQAIRAITVRYENESLRLAIAFAHGIDPTHRE